MAVEFISTDHQKGHNGQLSVCSHRENSLADNAVFYFLLETGSKNTHAAVRVDAGGLSYLDFYENSTISNLGTELTTYNVKRDSSLVEFNTKIYHTPTISNNGDLLINALIPAGSGKHDIAGGSGGGLVRGPELILNKNTSHLVVLTNKSGAAIPIAISVGFYEVPLAVE